MAKSCPQCGMENSDAAKFCKQCATPLRGEAATRCPNGHVVAPGQTKCPICEAEKEKQKTLIEDPDAGIQSKGPASFSAPPRTPLNTPDAGARGRTDVLPPLKSGGSAPPGRAASRGATVVLPSPVGGAKAEPVSERKVVGVLVSYTTRPDGQIFAVREGRNRIGRNAENEIAVPDDIAMSGLNSFIIFHPQGKKQFMVDDANSQNGTFVNGEIIEDRSRLPNYSEIKAGSTVFKFIAIEPASPVAKSSTTAPEDSQKGGVDGADMSEL